MRHIIPISGKDSLATAIVQMARVPDLPYEFIYNDTRMELPDTYAWIELVEKTMGIHIVRSGKSLANIIAEQKVLPSPRMRYCTRLSKIHPMRDFIGEDSAMLYIGIRADENRTGAEETRNTRVCYPLKETGVNLALVYRICGDRGLLPPPFFWKRVHAAVVAKMGADSWVIDELPQWVFDRTFAWRSRPNCFMCFYQRLYEWAGLLDHHPELFANAEDLESNFGKSEKTTSHAFLWLGPDRPLSFIRENFDRLVQKRVDNIVRLLRKRLQMELFTEALIDELEAAQTSCGLYCGK
jgi:hypothetical protein